MGKLHELRIRSEQFISRLPDMIDESILFVENQLLDLNREQLKDRQVDIFDKDMPEYSSKWKAIKGLTYYNLFNTGDFQNKLGLTVKYPEYIVKSTSKHTQTVFGLPKLQGRQFLGISKQNIPEAKRLTSMAFKRKYESFVLRK